MDDGAIEVSELVKTFGGFRALDGLELSVATGEVHGFLGPNGAGKSTTIRVLLGLLRAGSGDVRLLGGDPWRDAVALHRRLARARRLAHRRGAGVRRSRRVRGAGQRDQLGDVRHGRGATARRRLTSPLGLALRLQRGLLLGWSAGLFVSGLSVGLTGRDAKSLVGDNDQLGTILGSARGDIVDQYFAVSMLTMALIGAGFGVQAALRMRGEETAGHLESLLATALSRRAWAGAYVAVAMGGSLLVLAANGLGAGLADAVNSDDAGQLPRLLAAGLAPVPAVWVVAGAAVALFGLVPRAVVAAWGVLGACAVLTVLGPLLSLPDWALAVSPFKHVPQLPADDFTSAPLVWLAAVAAALTALGMLAFRRRDLAT